MLIVFLLACRHPNSTNSLLWFADDQGNTDPNAVVLDTYVDVRLANTSASKPYPIVSNADAVVSILQDRLVYLEHTLFVFLLQDTGDMQQTLLLLLQDIMSGFFMEDFKNGTQMHFESAGLTVPQ
jgi:hypothetical protein